MSLEKPLNERQELYEAFRRHLANPSDNKFFDADDLVIIIDQAVDIDDTYVQFEAVIQGLKYFPDNEEINVRKGFLFYNIECDEGVLETLEQRKGNSPLWTILRLRVNETILSAETADELLNQVLNSTDKFDDELAIQIVDAAAATMRHDWLVANEQQLRAKTEYLPALLYEMYNVFTRSPHRARALEILDELVEMEPFVVDFWIALAREQSVDDQYDKALTSIDYALAIESDNAQAISLKASLLGESSKHQEVFQLLDPIKQAGCIFDNPPEVVAYFYALYETSRKEEAFDMLETNFSFNHDHHFVDIALRHNHPKAFAMLTVVLENEHDATRWLTTAREFYAHECYAEASTVYMAIDSVIGLSPEEAAILYSALYLGGMYEPLVEQLQHFVDTQNSHVPIDLVLSGLLAAAKSMDKGNVKKLFEGVKSLMPLQIPTAWVLMSPLTQFGFSSFLHSMELELKKSGKLNLDLDIFTPPPLKF